MKREFQVGDKVKVVGPVYFSIFGPFCGKQAWECKGVSTVTDVSFLAQGQLNIELDDSREGSVHIHQVVARKKRR